MPLRPGAKCLPAVACALAALCLCLGARASAQTLKESLQEHMAEGVEREREQEQKRREDEQRKQQEQQSQQAQHPAPSEPDTQKQSPPPAAAPAPQGGLHFAFDSRDDTGSPSEPAPPPGPALPIRVIGKDLQLDITLGAGYRGWLPQRYQAVDVHVGNYATWNIDVKAKFFGWLALRRGYYESNGVAPPRDQDAAVAAKIGSYAPKAMRALGILGIPITKAWEPQVRYEAYGFETRAQPTKNVCVVDRSASGNATGCPGSMGELKIVSAFETFVAGVHYDHSKTDSPVVGPKTGKIPPIFVGVGLMQYRKPYQVNVNGSALDDYLFDSRFRGIGLALGTEIGGGVDNFFAEIDAQLGAGEVSLSDHLTLNQVIPTGYTIGYIQGTATLGYR